MYTPLPSYCYNSPPAHYGYHLLTNYKVPALCQSFLCYLMYSFQGIPGTCLMFLPHNKEAEIQSPKKHRAWKWQSGFEPTSVLLPSLNPQRQSRGQAVAGGFSKVQTFGENVVGSTSKILLHRGKKTSSPIRWGVCISNSHGGCCVPQVGRVSGRSLSPSITHKPFVCRGEPRELGWHQAEHVNH